jgi:hypothetical protein
MNETIRIFKRGKGTFCEWSFASGEGRGRILNEGDGLFLDKTFRTIDEAKEFCRAEIRSDASLVFEVMSGDEILETALDAEWHRAKERRSGLVYAIASSAVMALIACGISIGALRFDAVWAHGLFVVGMIALYVLLLAMYGTGNIEGAVAMIIILILIAVIAPKIMNKMKANKALHGTTDSRANADASVP